MSKKTRLIVGISSLLMALMMGAFTVSAQDLPLSLNIGENVTGSITPAAPTLRYVLLVDQPQILDVRVFAITIGLLPMVTAFDGNNNIIGVAQNNGSQTAVHMPGCRLRWGCFV